MKGIRTVVLGAALAFSVTSVAAAQDQGVARGGGRGNNPQAQMRALLKDITVTPEVATKIEAILTKVAADRREIMMAAGGGGGGRVAMDDATRAKVTELQTRAYADIKALLTADQVKTFEANVAAMPAQGRGMRTPPPPRS